jgi:hypothetical protein
MIVVTGRLAQNTGLGRTALAKLGLPSRPRGCPSLGGEILFERERTAVGAVLPGVGEIQFERERTAVGAALVAALLRVGTRPTPTTAEFERDDSDIRHAGFCKQPG